MSDLFDKTTKEILNKELKDNEEKTIENNNKIDIDNVMNECVNMNRECEADIPINYVKKTNDELLLIIQENTREYNIIQKNIRKQAEDLKTLVNKLRGDTLQKEEIKELGTGKEREQASKGQVESDTDYVMMNKAMKSMENTKRSIYDELSLAKEIYKLKNKMRG